MANRLIDATSPYLLQHAHNPVDWYPWGSEALERARVEDRPILLSIGYAACHWCHVMERESFTDPETARVMNERFVNIKVDREERPDLDGIYMSAVQAMTGHGGWPMTVFLTPDGKPFWGGTYFPPEPRHGMPSFRQVLAAIHDAWTTKRSGVLEQGEQLTQHIARAASVPGEGAEPSLERAARAMIAQHDAEWGGFGDAPKFPQPMTLSFLLRMHARGVEGALGVVEHTLERMARGGIFDQIGGGFHRYATDRIWLVPHFEKMLYDNAQLMRLYAEAWQVTGSTLFRDTALATAEHLLRDLRQQEGGFSSSLDADTDGVEGRTYVWDYEEFIALAGDDMPLAVAAFAVAGSGNWEGTNVLSRPFDDARVAAETGATTPEVRAAVTRVSARLLEARAARAQPASDDKVLAGWNGMAIAALAQTGRTFGRADLVEAAARAADFVLRSLRVDGRLHRAWRAGRTSGPGFLDDHAHMADACLTLYETTFERAWWDEARALVAEIERLFVGEDGRLYDTGIDAETTIVRPRDLFDNAVPGGNAAAADVMLRVAALTGESATRARADAFIAEMAPLLERAPLGFGSTLSAADRARGPGVEIAIIGTGDAARALADAAHRGYVPCRVVAAGPSGSAEPALLAGREEVDGAAAAYVCRDFVCALPVTSPAAVEGAVKALAPAGLVRS